MTNFYNEISKYIPEQIRDSIYSVTTKDVERVLSLQSGNLEDFCVLISPVAQKYLKELTSISQCKTQKRFGKTVQLFIPLYLSNYCENSCVYCGFNTQNSIQRTVLNESQIMVEVEVLKKYGYEHILLVTGEAPHKAGVDYLFNVIKLIKPFFSSISIEVQPLDRDDYEKLISAGLNTVYVYQETYDQKLYSHYHTRGRKADFLYRLETPDRLGQAGIRRIGIGTLLGLNDWRIDAFYTALHLKYLEKKYWKTRYSISFPRIRPHEGGFKPPFNVTDKDLVQLICAYRFLDEDVEMSLSVRESQIFRNNAIHFGITSMSAGSKTEPGGYASSDVHLKQFEELDSRTPAEIVKMIKSQGYEPVWKDWDRIIME